jgi:phage baseplate assembly protein W
MAGIDRNTGKRIDGWPEVAQSLQVLVSTRLRTRVMRRWFGSTLPRVVDHGIAPGVLIDYYAALAETFSPRNEPRFRLARMRLSEDSDPKNGIAIFDYEGLYYPRGHLGDFSIVETARGTVALSDEMVRR